MKQRIFTPVTRKLLIDGETALACFLKLANRANSFLFESVQGPEKWARYSFIGLQANELYKCYGHKWQHYIANECVEERHVDDPLAEIERLLASFSVAKLAGMPRFTGGLVGYCSYDVSRYVEPKLAAMPMNPDPIGTPDIYLMLCRDLVIFDNLTGTATLLSHYDENESESDALIRLDSMQKRINQPLGPQPELDPDSQGGLVDEVMAGLQFDVSFSEQDYKDSVLKIKEHILAGDVFQTVPSQRMSLDFPYEPVQLYRALRYINPSPYMIHLRLDDFDIVCSSPEAMARLEDGMVTVRPIAGTMPRGATEEEDRALAEKMLADEKEVAEHLMLIDLARNDVGRIAEIGSVRVTDTMKVERYSHVMHIVSNVVGKLAGKKNCVDVLRATLPAGTLAGAPKIRAMEIINELEPVKRGVYSGAIGYLDWHGNMDTAVLIRTAVIRDNRLHIQAGGGIVADSDPETEWQETLNKRKAIFRAIAMVLSAEKKQLASEKKQP